MLGLLRLLVVGFLVLSVIYVTVSLYSRSVRREKLEDRADDQIAEGTLAANQRETYIEQGMRDYEQSLRRKLILGVYIIPAIAALAVIYATNFM